MQSPYPNQQTPTSLTAEEKNWAMACHLSALAWFVPSAHIVGPLVIWLMKRDSSPFIDQAGKHALNFNISMTIYAVIAWMLIVILIGIPLLIVLAAVQFILPIIAAVKTANGEDYQYPMVIKFLS